MNVAVLGNLASKGLFRDGLRDQIEEDFLPWLQNETVSRVEVTNVSKQVRCSYVTLQLKRKFAPDLGIGDFGGDDTGCRTIQTRRRSATIIVG